MRFNIRESVETDSEGTPLSPEQVEFFKNSKIRDRQGRLLVCYHGSNAKFDKFDVSKIHKYPGFWFTTDNDYAASHGASTYAFYLDARNPLDMEANDNEAWGILNHLFGDNTSEDKFWTKEFRDALIKLGYDCFMWEHSGYYTYVVLYPNQIKSITNRTPTNSDNINEDTTIKKDPTSGVSPTQKYHNRLSKRTIRSIAKQLNAEQGIDCSFVVDAKSMTVHHIDDTKGEDGLKNNSFDNLWFICSDDSRDSEVVHKLLHYIERNDIEYDDLLKELNKIKIVKYDDASGKFIPKTLRDFKESCESFNKGLKEDMDLNFDKALLDKWIDRLNAKGADVGKTYTYKEGGKYIKVIYTYGGHDLGSVFAFVDADGNIYKPAGWQAPAKGVRARIDDNPPVDGKDLYAARYRKAVYGENLKEGEAVASVPQDQDIITYKQFQIEHFPYTMQYGDKEEEINAWVIKSPYYIGGQNGKPRYYMPLYCEDENGEVIDFDTLDQAKKYVDDYLVPRRVKIRIKNRDEVHAVVVESLNEDIDLPDNLFANLPDGWWNRTVDHDDDKDYQHPWVGKEIKVKDSYYHPIQVIVARSKPYVNDSSDFIYTVSLDSLKKGKLDYEHYYHSYDGFSYDPATRDYNGDKGWKFTGRTYNQHLQAREGIAQRKYQKYESLNGELSEPLDEQIISKDNLHNKLWNMEHKEQICFRNGYCVTCYFHDGEGMAKRYTVTNRDGKKVLDCNAGFAWQPQIQKFEDSLLQLLNTGSIKEDMKSRIPEQSNLKKILVRFNSNGKYAKQGSWSIASGGYDLNFEIYYQGQPVIQGTQGYDGTEVEAVDSSYADELDTNAIIEFICSAYKDCTPIYKEEEVEDDEEDDVEECVKEEILTEKPSPAGYEPTKKGIAYKVFKVKNGKLYPPMVANAGGADTPIGVWLDAEEGEFAGLSKTGRPQVKSTGSGNLSYRPGWHLGDIPRAKQFDRLNKETGEYEFPKDFVWAECEYAMDVDYQPESDARGYERTKVDKDGNVIVTKSDKYQHSLAGLPKLPTNGYYKYRTNPNPDTVPWVITGQMKVNRLLSDAEVNAILEKNGIEPIHRQGGDKTLAELGLKEGLGEDWYFHDDDSYFSHEQLLDFASDLEDAIQARHGKMFTVTSVWFEKDNSLVADVQVGKYGDDMLVSQKVDMRRVKTEKDLRKYIPTLVDQVTKQAVDDNY